MAVALINGVEYTFSNITIDLLGGTILGCDSISYNYRQNSTNNYGVGNKPVSTSQGAIMFENCTIALHHSELIALRNLAAQGLITTIAPFDITVAFEVGGNYTAHRLSQCRFLNDGMDMQKDSEYFVTSIDFLPGDIDLNFI